MKSLKLIATSALLFTILQSCSTAETPAKTETKNEAASAPTAATPTVDGKFAGTYKVKTSDGKVSDQIVTISLDNNTYQYKSADGKTIPTQLSDDGNKLTIKSEESSSTAADGTVTANLGGTVTIYFEGDKLIHEITIPELGSEKMELVKQ